MNIEDQKKSQNLQSNILKFPGTKNPKVEEQQKEFARNRNRWIGFIYPILCL